MSGRVVHFEVPYDDAERAGTFYAEAFGWSLRPAPQMSYTLLSTGPSDQGVPNEPGFINGGMLERAAGVRGPMLTIDVEDIDAALAKVEAFGGSTVAPKEPVADHGFSAYFTDTEGNLMALWQDA